MASQSSVIIVYITTPTKVEAKRLARILLDEHLIACANIIDMCSSLYRWKGKIEEVDEVILLMKTTAEKWKSIEKRVRELHSYECPCIAKIAIEDGSREYLKWIKASVL